MKIKKAVITAAGGNQRTLPLQTLIDRDGNRKSVLSIIVEETLRAGVGEIGVVVQPGDETPYLEAAGAHSELLRFIHQTEPRGYGHAVYCAKDFIGPDPFLHLVGDHLYISGIDKGCAQQLVEAAEVEGCSISAVQATRENLLPYYGVIGGPRTSSRLDLYKIEIVMEKPTPTEAEQRLHVPGLRSGYYLCFFGMHVLTPTVMDILAEQLGDASGKPISAGLSPALAELAKREQYLAMENKGWRCDIGSKYGLFIAQLALALNGKDRDEVLSQMLELMAIRELGFIRK